MHPIRVKLPNKPPKVIQKEQQPDQRQFAVVPIRATTDRKLTPMQLRVLMVFCTYSNRGGITWVGLKRVGSHLGIGVARTATLAKALIDKGYMRVLFKGYAGERAQTRQIIYNSELSLDDVIAVSGEKAPYMVQQDIREQTKGEKMARKKKVNDPLVSNIVQSNLLTEVSYNDKLYKPITEEQVIQLQRTVGADLLAHVISQCDPNPTLEQVQTKLKELLA